MRIASSWCLCNTSGRPRGSVRGLAGPEDIQALGVQQTLGHKLADLATGQERGVEVDERGGPEPPGGVLSVDALANVIGPDAGEGPSEVLIVGYQLIAEREDIHRPCSRFPLWLL